MAETALHGIVKHEGPAAHERMDGCHVMRMPLLTLPINADQYRQVSKPTTTHTAMRMHGSYSLGLVLYS